MARRRLDGAQALNPIHTILTRGGESGSDRHSELLCGQADVEVDDANL